MEQRVVEQARGRTGTPWATCDPCRRGRAPACPMGVTVASSQVSSHTSGTSLWRYRIERSGSMPAGQVVERHVVEREARAARDAVAHAGHRVVVGDEPAAPLRTSSCQRHPLTDARRSSCPGAGSHPRAGCRRARAWRGRLTQGVAASIIRLYNSIVHLDSQLLDAERLSCRPDTREEILRAALEGFAEKGSTAPPPGRSRRGPA